MADDIMQTDICRRNLSKTFHDLSSSKRDNPQQPERFAVAADSTAGRIHAVDFDAVKEEWAAMPEKNYAGKPCSADALYCKDDEICLIEFKTGKLTHTERKLYDSVLMLVENFPVTIQQIREKASYIVVASKWPSRSDRDESISRASQLMKASWKDSALTHKDALKQMGFANLDGVVVSHVYGMSPREFDVFVKESGWNKA